jgi:hypothetical protein
MYESDRQYLSRFSLDPEIEFRWEDLYRFDVFHEFAYDDEMDTLDDEKILDVAYPIPENSFLSEKLGRKDDFIQSESQRAPFKRRKHPGRRCGSYPGTQGP